MHAHEKSKLNQNLIQRIASALVLLPIVVWAIAQGGWWLYAFVLISGIVCFWEYGGVTGAKDSLARPLAMTIGVTAQATAMLVPTAESALVVVELASVLIAIIYTLNVGDIRTVWSRMSVTAFGVPYIAFSFAAVFHLRTLGDALPERTSPLVWVWLPLLVSWSNDTCAYFAGRAFGKTKLYPLVSPKKTWEGFVGGALGTVVIPLILLSVLGAWLPDVTATDILFIAIPAAFLAPLGDLAESLLKRSFDTKDSGNIIPGHGGLLDRVDAVFFVAPWALFYVAVLRPLVQ